MDKNQIDNQSNLKYLVIVAKAANFGNVKKNELFITKQGKSIGSEKAEFGVIADNRGK